MKLVALLLLGLAATASANKCGWKKPSDILTPSTMTLQHLPNNDASYAGRGDAVAVSFDLDYNIYQYRIQRVSAGGRTTLVDFDNDYYNLQYPTSASSISGQASLTSKGFDGVNSAVTSRAAVRQLVDVYHAGNTQDKAAMEGALSAHAAANRYKTLQSTALYDGFENRASHSGETIGQQFEFANGGKNASQGVYELFNNDYSMIIGNPNGVATKLQTKVVYIVSVRSLRCGRAFYSSNSERGILLKGLFTLEIDFSLQVQDGAVVGTTSMGMDGDGSSDVSGLIFVKHADEVVAEAFQTLNLESFTHDVSITGQLALTGDDGSRECAGESAGGHGDGVTDDISNPEMAAATLDARNSNYGVDRCKVTGTVVATHHDSTASASADGNTFNGGEPTEENNGDGANFTSVDHDTVNDEMTGPYSDTRTDYRAAHNLKDAEIVTFLSLAQYVMTDDTPSCNSMLTLSEIEDGTVAPTWFQNPGAGMTITDGTYGCATSSGFNRTSWTGGQCAAIDSSGCNDTPYIIARHGSTAKEDDKTLGDITKGPGREGCTTNQALEDLLNSDTAYVGGMEYNFTCSYGYTKDDGSECDGTDLDGDASTPDVHKGCNTHTTRVEFTPFYGFDGDSADSPLQYTRMWFGRTTDNHAIKNSEKDDDNNPVQGTEFDAVDANSTTGEQDAHNRRLRGVEKVRKLLKAAPKTVNEMYQQTFHFKVRAPPGKLRHRHRHH